MICEKPTLLHLTNNFGLYCALTKILTTETNNFHGKFKIESGRLALLFRALMTILIERQ